jgi:hypothetical protein
MCVVMSGSAKTPGMWKNIDCGGKYPFICSKENGNIKVK